MALDYIYYFDKKSPFDRHTLGEVQSDFGMGLTIDGAKDSLQVQVYGFVENELVPNTILFHNATNTWWVVRRDIVKRYANESTYWFTHNLTLVGAIDLLNARDLTDCGFNDDTYTIDQFIKRLFQLSTFEFPITINYGNNIDENKLVDYIKSFENYTLLSALREFLNGYNCDAKLTFEIFNRQLVGAILNIIPRTGNVDLPQVDIDEFDDIRETKTINKESYGTTVISNAQNVVSTLTKTYPQVGGVKLSSDNYSITPSNAILRLPTPIYKVNWVKLLHAVVINVHANDAYTDFSYTFRSWNKFSMESTFEEMANTIADRLSVAPFEQPPYSTRQEIYDYIMSIKDYFLNEITKVSHITVETGWSIKPILSSGTPSQDLVEPSNNDTFRFRNIFKLENGYSQWSRSLLLGSKEDYEAVVQRNRCMYYERGDNKIHNFEWLGASGAASGDSSGIQTYESTDYNSNQLTLANKVFYGAQSFTITLQQIGNTPTTNNYMLRTDNTYFQVNYIPMSDLKIKYDNDRNDIDSSIYNQNGKLNDSVALSKLIDSHSKEIQSNNITRYMHYTNFNDIPQVGSIVNVSGEKYIINNISYDFYFNETNNNSNVGYYIECEFTLSKYVSVKSLMVNPNSNIRDYGIPQKFNVKRKQTYRDYFGFSLSADSLANLETPYVSLDKYIVIGSNTTPRDYDHTAIMKIDYEQPVDGNESWFYQVNSTAYILSKELCEVIDFEDNNIIGYDMQNVHTGFNMSKLYGNTWKGVNVPISYVDDNGKFTGITLQFVSKEKLDELYDNISLDTGSIALYSSHVFVGSEFYYGKYNNNVPTTENVSAQWESDVNGNARVIYNFTKPANYESESMSVDNFIVQDENDQWLPSATVSVYDITETQTQVVITLDIQTGLNYSIGSIVFRLNYTIGEQVYAGAIDIKDYEIKELDYNKDAIEVPVFEYILQLGDTEEVEVGERILDTQSGMLQMYTCDIRQANTTTQLNASKVFNGLSVSGDTLTDDNYDRQVEIADTSAVDISFESNNTIMRIKVYDTQTALFYGNAEQDFDYQNTQVSQVQKPKSYLLGKDIVIYKNVIKSMTYDIDEDVATCDYDNELMFIIHNPQDSNFDGDDLLVNVNYYKLK